MAKADIYMVTTSFVATINGRDIEYHTGELVDADDPALKIVPEHFGEPVFKHRAITAPAAPVEQATAAPGETRGKAVTLAGMKGQG
jgi:hypothetical protein